MFEDPQLEVSVKLSAPIYVLKAQAKELKQSKSISMTEALNEIAQREGYSSWSLLQSKSKELIPQTRDEVLGYLNAGDLVLVGSRPGFGKTTFALKLILQAVGEGKRCFLFSLEESRKQIAARVADINENLGENNPNLLFDFSEEISSEYIIKKCTGKLESGSLIAIDYLQLLDQQRNKPHLQSQIQDLKAFAKEHSCILIFISQLDRNFESTAKERPELQDVRLPNPLDLGLFNKVIFLHENKVWFAAPRKFELS